MKPSVVRGGGALCLVVDTVAWVPSLDLQYLHFISVPLDSGVAEDVEELAPQLQVSGGVGEWLPPDLADHLRGWRGAGGCRA